MEVTSESGERYEVKTGPTEGTGIHVGSFE